MKKVDVKTLNKRQRVGLVGILVVMIVIATMIMVATRPNNEDRELFELSETVYEGVGLVEISAEEYEAKIEARENFLVLAHTVACPAGMPLTDLMKELANEEQMQVYGLGQEEFKKSSLAGKMKYLPSVAIIHKGVVTTWLDAESNSDLPAYKSLDGLKEWLKKYIKL